MILSSRVTSSFALDKDTESHSAQNHLSAGLHIIGEQTEFKFSRPSPKRKGHLASAATLFRTEVERFSGFSTRALDPAADTKTTVVDDSNLGHRLASMTALLVVVHQSTAVQSVTRTALGGVGHIDCNLETCGLMGLKACTGYYPVTQMSSPGAGRTILHEPQPRGGEVGLTSVSPFLAYVAFRFLLRKCRFGVCGVDGGACRSSNAAMAA